MSPALGSRSFQLGSFLVLFFFAVFLTASSNGQQSSVPSDPAATAASQTLSIPDGMPVPLRFAQPLRGKVKCMWKAPCVAEHMPEAKANDVVRLVAGSDVRVGHLVVIAKGAPGQATVTKVWRPFMALAGLALRFDWIEDVTGKHVPLRLEKKGKPEAFTIQVLSTTGGMVARKETLRGDLAGKDTFDMSLIWHKKNWIPAGTRIGSFTHGATARDLADVTDAQALLPISNDVATLTIYRMKGDHETHLRVSCDGNNVGLVDAERYLVTDLSPGKHTCGVEQQSHMEITASAGEDYFLRLQSSTPGSWELKLMDAGEGEDTIATLEPVARNPGSADQ